MAEIYGRVLIQNDKNTDVSKVHKLNVDSTLKGCFHIIEYMTWKFILTSLSISRRPPKERICFPAGKLFLSEQIPLERIALSGEADRMSPNLSPLRSDDKIPLRKVATYQRYMNSALIRRCQMYIVLV